MSLKRKAKQYLIELKEKWETLRNTPTVFAYNLNVVQQKFLPGQHQFYVELNPERSTLRRPPQTIPTLKPLFDEEKFNFKKINPLELILNIPYESADIAMIINKSPLTMYHTLICPDVAAGHAQFITLAALCFSASFLMSLNEVSFRIGYNSPGALASVNHLHLHLMQIEVDLYIDKAKLEPLKTTRSVYRLDASMPTEAICFVIYKSDNDNAIAVKLKELYEFMLWLCERNFPHNLFMTMDRSSGNVDALKIFVYAREQYCFVKDLTTYNVAFCEFSGYIPVGDKNIFDKISEQLVISKIQEETGGVYKHIYKYFLK